jgi:hypothetical protein
MNEILQIIWSFKKKHKTISFEFKGQKIQK